MKEPYAKLPFQFFFKNFLSWPFLPYATAKRHKNQYSSQKPQIENYKCHGLRLKKVYLDQ
jgi:hypothetical protein